MTDVVEMGLITFDSALSAGTVDDAAEIINGYVSAGDKFMVHSNGIFAKKLGDALYFKVYAKLSDGSYVYSELAGYHAVAYAKDILANSSNEKMKSLVVAMLNYGAAAQIQFNYKTDSLMNSFLSAEQRALVSDYSSAMVTTVPKVDSAKVGEFGYVSGGYKALYPNVSFEGAFSVKFYFTPAKPMGGELTMYYWSAADYAEADVLAAKNATGVITMAELNGTYVGTVEGIAARQIDETIYVAGVYESDGVVYATGVIAYSLGTYCLDRVTNGSENMPALAEKTIVYGNYAKAYFV
jgi:hypothetical protein